MRQRFHFLILQSPERSGIPLVRNISLKSILDLLPETKKKKKWPDNNI